MKDIYKAFGSNQVLNSVNFEILDGEVHALMGENGAGKSTLMNILTGVHFYDQGKIIINGEEKVFSNPKEAENFGITFIHQEINTWSDMTVLDNLFIGKELSSFGFVKTKDMRKIAQAQFDKLGISIPLDKEAGLCSVGQQQMIEIAKALMTDAKIIIMDEPTAALTERESEKLFEMIETLKKDGVSIIYISHRMEEIFRICDRVTVMRDGKTVDTKDISETYFDDVVMKMVGRELKDRFPSRVPQIGEVVLEVKDLTKKGAFENINFTLKSGEILGFSGLMGAGRTEIMHTIFGMNSCEGGDVFVKGQKVSISKPYQAVEQGIGFVTEDRKIEGLILDFSVRENISIPSLNSFSPKGIIKTDDEKDFVDLLIKRLTVKTASREISVGSLSGGNQQKVVIAKWVGVGTQILILDEPTRGVDVGAKREIYQLMNELTERGVAIIMVSSELPEVLGMSDRIIVVHEGKITGELSKEEATQEKIMKLATGGQ